MAEVNFIETDAKKISDTVLEELENGVNEPLYPGDERRIFGEALVPVVVSLYNSLNDGCRQRLLRYARGKVLDALGENRDTFRLDPTFATTTLRFTVNEPFTSNIIIPAGLRVTGDFVRYFLTDSTVVLYAGSLSVDVTATAENGGAEYNAIAPGELVNIVDVSEVPLIDGVTNITEASGGGDMEGDDAYRERIRTAENRLSTAGTAKAYKYWALSANPLVTDAVVLSTTEKIERKVTVKKADSKRYVFVGGSYLLVDTLEVWDNQVAYPTKGVRGKDYLETYKDDLLEIEIYTDGVFATNSTLKIKIDRDMAGIVKIVPICAGGEIPDEGVLADVLAACTSDDVKPLTDRVQVQAPDVEYYDIEVTYWTTKANESEVVQNVEGSGGAIDQYVYWQGSTLSQDINPDELWKRITCPHWAEGLTGATRAVITKPEYKELPSTTVAKFSGNLKVQHFVKD